MKHPNIKKTTTKHHFVPQGRSHGLFATITTLVLLVIIVIAYIQFTPLRYSSRESVSVQLLQPEQKIVTLVDEEQIKALYEEINAMDKSFDGFHKPSEARGYLFLTNVNRLSDKKEKFQEVKPNLVWEEGHIFQGAKSYKLSPEALTNIETMILEYE